MLEPLCEYGIFYFYKKIRYLTSRTSGKGWLLQDTARLHCRGIFHRNDARQHWTVLETGNFRFWWPHISPFAALTLPGFRMSSTMIFLPPPRHTFTASGGPAGPLAVVKRSHLSPEKIRLWFEPSIGSSVARSNNAPYLLLTMAHRRLLLIVEIARSG